MSKYIQDQAQIALSYESGTYASTSGAAFWVGMTQTHDGDDDTGVIPVRYVGQTDRNVGQYEDGPTGFTGTLDYFPQDFRMLKFALGLNTDAGSPSPFTHTYTEANSDDLIPETSGATRLPTFTLEDAQVTATGKNFVRTYAGCMVDSLSIAFSESNILSNSISYVAQSRVFSSGAKTAVTALTTEPFKFQHVAIDIPSGTRVANLKEGAFTLNNNLDPQHYVNASRNIGTPEALNRDYEVSLTLNGDDVTTKVYYDQYFVGGSTFNMQIWASIGVGSRDLTITCSGCKMMDMSSPTANEGVAEQTLTISPQKVSAVESSTVQYYNAGSYS